MTTKTAQSVGEILRKRRSHFKVSVRIVGNDTGIDFSVISRIERGENKISLENAIRLCEYYGFPLSRLAALTVRNKAGHII